MVNVIKDNALMGIASQFNTQNVISMDPMILVALVLRIRDVDRKIAQMGFVLSSLIALNLDFMKMVVPVHQGLNVTQQIVQTICVKQSQNSANTIGNALQECVKKESVKNALLMANASLFIVSIRFAQTAQKILIVIIIYVLITVVLLIKQHAGLLVNLKMVARVAKIQAVLV